jgi:hypothetical protein
LPRPVGTSFPITLALLSVLIAMSTQVIGDNVARAFSLVGALSIVRFRTVVRDTKDTAYVIFAVVCIIKHTRIAWFALVLPTLLVNYFGQGAQLLADPEMLVLGGFMADAADLLLEPVRAEIARRLPRPMLDALAIVPATLGADAAAIGAARHAASPRR